jgi:hypothetical protein
MSTHGLSAAHLWQPGYLHGRGASPLDSPVPPWTFEAFFRGLTSRSPWITLYTALRLHLSFQTVCPAIPRNP